MESRAVSLIKNEELYSPKINGLKNIKGRKLCMSNYNNNYSEINYLTPIRRITPKKVYISESPNYSDISHSTSIYGDTFFGNEKLEKGCIKNSTVRNSDSYTKDISFLVNTLKTFSIVSIHREDDIIKKTLLTTESQKSHNTKQIWKKKPFVPKINKKAPTVPKTPKLLTACRAKEREHFQELIKQKEMEIIKRKQIEVMASKKHEEAEVARLRKETVHKAKPIRKYKELPPCRKRPLTEPHSPNFSKIKRQRRV